MSFAASAWLCLLPGAAEAGPKEDAYAALQTWEAAFNSSDINVLAPIYLPDATVQGIISSTLIVGEAALREYFMAPLRARAQVRLGDMSAQQLSDEAVVLTGYDEFSATLPDGKSISIPGRYTFVMVRRNGQWKIAHQHSSSRFRPQ
ncbi:SgcJ/EcaC family oxidoreductase [Phreatobacter stygius]|uniref:SgcJ/EcaC family oxidoreductase n=1 Tax=Phreatobacter stygius TaxID=1940610 RepID=UPI001476B469|nr:nuclear transport factor 2 family protein [Phreatobacter stygius]